MVASLLVAKILQKRPWSQYLIWHRCNTKTVPKNQLKEKQPWRACSKFIIGYKHSKQIFYCRQQLLVWNCGWFRMAIRNLSYRRSHLRPARTRYLDGLNVHHTSPKLHVPAVPTALTSLTVSGHSYTHTCFCKSPISDALLHTDSSTPHLSKFLWVVHSSNKRSKQFNNTVDWRKSESDEYTAQCLKVYSWKIVIKGRNCRLGAPLTARYCLR